MSQKEVDRLQVLQQVESRRVSQKAAAGLLGLSTRHVRRLQQHYSAHGAAGLISKRRGAPSHNCLSEEVLRQALVLIQTHYPDFGPTLAHEKLTEVHGLRLSVESTRQLMLTQGLWKTKPRKATAVHQRRQRRSRLGELVQIDGSPHDWFEERGPRCCLLVFIDDATSRLLWLQFVPAESTDAYFSATEGYLKRFGRPLSFYADRHSIFRVHIKGALQTSGETQFGRALRELDIELICARSPQAKGRVEKANRTLQDRLVKEMRLRNILTLSAGNDFLPQFIEDYNRRFAVEAADPVDAHREHLPGQEILERLLSRHYQRTLSKNLELSYNGTIYQIKSKTIGYGLRGAKVSVYDRQGVISVVYKGRSMIYSTCPLPHKKTAILSSQELSTHRPKRVIKPKADHPWRHYLPSKRQTSHAKS